MNSSNFSKALIKEINEIIGEVSFEVSEGLHNGLKDYQFILNQNLAALVS